MGQANPASLHPGSDWGTSKTHCTAVKHVDQVHAKSLSRPALQW
jgi:hypothetical protein